MPLNPISDGNEEFDQSTDLAIPPIKAGGIMQIKQIKVAEYERYLACFSDFTAKALW